MTSTSKLCIVGLSALTMDWYKRNLDCELWSMNQWYLYLEHPIHRWFQADKGPWTEHHKSKMQQYRDIPIYTLEPHHELPNNRVLDIRQLSQGAPPMFGGVIAYMLAMAHLEGWQDIRLAGVDIGVGSTNDHQRESVMFWLGRILEAGRILRVAPGSPLFDEPVYGHEPQPQALRQLIQEEHIALQGEIRNNVWQFQALNGAAQMLERVQKRLSHAYMPTELNLEIPRHLKDIAVPLELPEVQPSIDGSGIE